jgi:hypothetical protein
MTDDTTPLENGSNERSLVDRRTVLAATAGTVALTAGAGAADAHTLGSTSSSSSTDGHDHTDASLHGATSDVELLDYHSLGDVGSSSETGGADSPHYGAITELRVHGDYAYVGVFSAKDPTNDRGMYVLDVSEFNAASNTSDLRDAELEVVSFLRNPNAASAVMDVKVSDDGDYVFLGKQPYSAVYDDLDPVPTSDGDDATASAAAIQAVDVSDPANPEVVGSYDAWDTGPHNAWYHRIDGTEYVFAIHDTQDGTSGIWVFEFDRTTGALVLLEKWNADGHISDGNLVDDDLRYAHDIVVQDDPRLGIPVAYFSYWSSGLFALDASDPTSMEVIGHFSMPVTHYAEPAPEFIDGKRVVVVGQEQSSQTDGTSGYVKLLDADGLDEGYDGSDNMTELDTWEWQSSVSFSNFTLSPHNFDVTADRWVHLGHYHGGTRFFRIHPDDWTLEEKGYFQAAKDVPEDSKMAGLNHAAPFTWCAVSHEGVVYASDINTGVYALRHKPSSSSATAPAVAGAAVLGGLLHRYRDRVGEWIPNTPG